MLIPETAPAIPTTVSADLCPSITTAHNRPLRETGHDQLIGSSGDDKLLGGQGNDRLFGQAGRDRIRGGLGDDQLDGGTGQDRLFGGAGRDRLIDRDGGDGLVGGAGADEFWIGNNTNGISRIRDFQMGRDRIKFTQLGLTYDNLSFDRQGHHTIISHQDQQLVKLHNSLPHQLKANNFEFGDASLISTLQTALQTTEAPGCCRVRHHRGWFCLEWCNRTGQPGK